MDHRRVRFGPLSAFEDVMARHTDVVHREEAGVVAYVTRRPLRNFRVMPDDEEVTPQVAVQGVGPGFGKQSGRGHVTVDAPDPGLGHQAFPIEFGDLGMAGGATAPLGSFSAAVRVVTTRAAEPLHLAFLELVRLGVGGKKITDERNSFRRLLAVTGGTAVGSGEDVLTQARTCVPGAGTVAMFALHPVEAPGADDPGEPALVPFRSVSRRMAPAAVVGDFLPGPEVHPVPALKINWFAPGPEPFDVTR